jgi:hypothetical protein
VAETTVAGEKQTEDRLECTKCGCRHFDTTHTMGSKRRRVCRNCGRPLMTREIPEALYKRIAAELAGEAGPEPVK